MKAVESKSRNLYGRMMIINALFFLLLHLTFVGFTNDDAFFVIVRSQWDSLIDLLIHRYLTDSSRVLSEAILFTLIRLPFLVWQILDTAICILVYHSLTVIFVNDKKSKNNVLIFLLFASYPYMHMGSAGWICTSLNYMWPLAAFLYAFSGVVRRGRKEKIYPLQYAAYIAAMIFTANCEMSATVLCMMFMVVFIEAVIEKRSAWFEILGVLIGIAGILFAMLAPGNGERTIMEAENWMPEFFDLNLLEKARLCSVFVFEHFVAIPDVIFFLFSGLLAVTGLDKAKKNWQKIVAVIPLLIDVLFTGYYFVKDFLLGHKLNYDFENPAIYMTDWKTMIIQLSEVTGLLLFIITAIYTIWNVLPEQKVKIGAIWALACGFAVRMALMLSPTMFASWHRTLIFLYFAFAANIILLAGQCKKRWMKVMIYVILFIGILVNLILTVGLQIRKAV